MKGERKRRNGRGGQREVEKMKEERKSGEEQGESGRAERGRGEVRQGRKGRAVDM